MLNFCMINYTRCPVFNYLSPQKLGICFARLGQSKVVKIVPYLGTPNLFSPLKSIFKSILENKSKELITVAPTI